MKFSFINKIFFTVTAFHGAMFVYSLQTTLDPHIRIKKYAYFTTMKASLRWKNVFYSYTLKTINSVTPNVSYLYAGFLRHLHQQYDIFLKNRMYTIRHTIRKIICVINCTKKAWFIKVFSYVYLFDCFLAYFSFLFSTVSSWFSIFLRCWLFPHCILA